MAFNSIVDDTRRMNAKMIAMGQSVDIQKMPRPKPGTQAAQKQAMFTPSGSDVEKMLYPKNFKARTFDASEIQQDSTIMRPQAETKETAQKEENAAMEIMEEVIEEEKQVPRIIGDDDIPPKIRAKADDDCVCAKPFPRNAWESCRHYKAQGERAFCREYLGWCAKDKCSRPKY